MIKRFTPLSLLGVFALGLAVYADVSYSPDAGGFVEKRDVKDALDVSEAWLQANADGLVFTFVDEATYEVPCLKENSDQTLYNTFSRSRGIDADIEVSVRRNRREIVTGFVLSPVDPDDEGSISGNVVCPGGWENNGWESIADLTPRGSNGGSLYVNDVAVPNAR